MHSITEQRREQGVHTSSTLLSPDLVLLFPQALVAPVQTSIVGPWQLDVAQDSTQNLVVPLCDALGFRPDWPVWSQHGDSATGHLRGV